MTELSEVLKAYKDFGFLVLFLITIYFFWKELKNSKSEVVEITKSVTTALDHAASAIEDMNNSNEDNRKTVDDIRVQNERFQAFLQGRDENRRSS